MEKEYEALRADPLVNSIIGLSTYILSLIIGCVILYTGIKCIKLVRAVAGLLFFGSLTSIIGNLILVYRPNDKPDTPPYLFFGCRIAIAIIFSILSGCYECIGIISLGTVYGWCIWSLFFDDMFNILICFIVGFIISLIGIVLTSKSKEKGQIVATFWLSCYLSVNGTIFSTLCVNSFFGNPSSIMNYKLPAIILTILFTMALFSFLYYCHFKKSASTKSFNIEV